MRPQHHGCQEENRYYFQVNNPVYDLYNTDISSRTALKLTDEEILRLWCTKPLFGIISSDVLLGCTIKYRVKFEYFSTKTLNPVTLFTVFSFELM